MMVLPLRANTGGLDAHDMPESINSIQVPVAGLAGKLTVNEPPDESIMYMPGLNVHG